MPVNYDNAVVQVNIFRSSGYGPSRDFSSAVYLVDLANNSLEGGTAIGTNDSLYTVVSSVGDLNLANKENAGSYSASTIAAVTAYFAQIARPKKLYIVAVDLVGGDTYANILETVYNNIPFTWICTNNRTAAIIVAVANALAALDDKTIYIAQSDSSLIKGSTGDYASGTFGTAFTNKQIVYGVLADDTAHMDMRHMGAFCTVDLYVDCPTGDIPVERAESSDYTTTELNNAHANKWNVNGAYGNKNLTRPGITLDGTDMYVLITEVFSSTLIKDYYTRYKLDQGKKKVFLDDRGRASIVGPGKQALDLLYSANHIESEYSCISPEITDSDRTNKIIRVNLSYNILHSARTVNVNVYMEV